MTTEFRAMQNIGKMVMQFEVLQILNISPKDFEKLQRARKELEEVLNGNGYVMNYDKTIKENILKIQKWKQ